MDTDKKITPEEIKSLFTAEMNIFFTMCPACDERFFIKFRLKSRLKFCPFCGVTLHTRKGGIVK